jgi:acetyl-CoA C-acetyltransferase
VSHTSIKNRDIYVVGAVRTAIGTFGGSLVAVPPSQLAVTVVRELIRRSAVDPARVGQVVMGNVIPTEPRDAYLARVAAIESGIPQEATAFNVNRLCGSGLQAVLTTAQSMMSGDAEVAIGGGAESMSRGPYLLASARWGSRMGDAAAVDYMLGILHDPFERIHMGLTAEAVAEREHITREMQDALAAESHRRAARAVAEGRFREQIVPVEVPARKGTTVFEVDEHVRADASIEQLAKMKPAFKPDGSVTAGNASGINDAAAGLMLATGEAVQRDSMKPLARLVSWGHAGVAPGLMGLGPVPASRIALQRAGLKGADLDVIESNEAFAAQACAVTQLLELDPAKVNPNGSGISLGHPVGATGAVIATKAIYELHRTGGRYALVTMCIGGGQGIAAIFERS